MPGVALPRPFDAYKGKEPYIFVSYAHKDAVLVYPDLLSLAQQGYRIWYDEGIDPGNEWTEDIARAINQSSFFLVYITPDSVKSKNVRNEIEFALNANKEFIAIHLAETHLPDGLQLQIGRIQAVLKYNQNDESYLQKITTVLPETLRSKSALGVQQDLLKYRAKLKQLSRATPIWSYGLGGMAFLGIILSLVYFNLGGTLRPSMPPTAVMVLNAPDSFTPAAALPHPSATLIPSTATPQPTATNLPPDATPTLGTGATQISPRDNMILLYVPQGNFLMGADSSDNNASPNEKPQRTIWLDAFWIDQTEVTNAMYKACIDNKYCPNPAFKDYLDPNQNNYPITGVSWASAATYCEWAGRSLPSEAQWEKAARGTDGRIYPWGNTAFDCIKTNHYHGCGYSKAEPVGSHPAGASPYGALDMAGNVLEWTSDWYDPSFYSKMPDRNPASIIGTAIRSIRGGAYMYNEKYLRTTARFDIYTNDSLTDHALGFRCAMHAAPAAGD